MLNAGFRYAFALSHSDADAEDLVQEACLKLFARSAELPAKALLLITIRHLYIDRYRRNKLVVIENDKDIDERYGDYDDIEMAIDHADLSEALSTLREQEREVIYLNIIEGYSCSEIAAMTEKSRSTILSLLQRGKAKLRNSLLLSANKADKSLDINTAN